MFKLKAPNPVTKGLGSFLLKPIQYEIRVPGADWSPWFGDYMNQKWGEWDSNSCWCLGGSINETEDQLEWLMANNMFSPEAIAFFHKYKYIDEDGDFSLSERFIEVLSGAHDNGNDQMEAWRLPQQFAGDHGMIPRGMLTYSHERAMQFKDKASFNKDYFDIKVITPEMRAIGQEFLKHVNIARQWVGETWETPSLDILRAALKQAPLAIGVPVPRDVSMWNRSYIKWDGKVAINHCVELYAINDKGEYLVFDQYEPHLKTLSADYLLGVVTQGVVTAAKPASVNPLPQPETNKIWTAIFNWFNKILNPKAGYATT